MGIAEKLITVAENVPKVFEAGKKAGGGGSGTSGRRTVEGTFTIDTSTGTPTITHNCGFVPTLFIVYPIDEYVEGDTMILGCVMTNTDYFSNIPFERTPNSVLENQASAVIWNTALTNAGNLTETTATLGYTSGSRLWRANFQYGWIAME